MLIKIYGRTFESQDAHLSNFEDRSLTTTGSMDDDYPIFAFNADLDLKPSLTQAIGSATSELDARHSAYHNKLVELSHRYPSLEEGPSECDGLRKALMKCYDTRSRAQDTSCGEALSDYSNCVRHQTVQQSSVA